MSLAVLYRVSNVELMDYPMMESMRSVECFADEICVAADVSVDNTNDMLCAMQAELGIPVKVKEYKFCFDRMWQQRAWDEAQSLTKCKWLMIMDADEAVRASEAQGIRESLRDNKRLVRFSMVHLYGTPDWEVRSKHFYPTHVRIGRRADKFGMKNFRTDRNRAPVCDVVYTQKGKGEKKAHHARGAHVADASARLFHYGWCRSSQAMAYRRVRGRAWYTNDPTYYEGSMPEKAKPFSYNMKKNKAHLHSVKRGAQPKVMSTWFEKSPHPQEWDALNKQLRKM